MMGAGTQTIPLTWAMRSHQERLGKPLRDALLEDFAGASTEALVREFQVSEMTLRRWLDRLGLERRLVIVERHEDDGVTGAASPTPPLAESVG